MSDENIIKFPDKVVDVVEEFASTNALALQKSTRIVSGEINKALPSEGDMALSQTSPLSLYRSDETESSNNIVTIYEIMLTLEEYLRRVRSDKEDVLSEMINITLLLDNFEKLHFISGVNQYLYDIATAVCVAIYNKSDNVFSIQQVNALFKLINKLKNNIILDENNFMECLTILDDSFNLIIPLPEEVDLLND